VYHYRNFVDFEDFAFHSLIVEVLMIHAYLPQLFLIELDKSNVYINQDSNLVLEFFLNKLHIVLAFANLDLYDENALKTIPICHHLLFHRQFHSLLLVELGQTTN
jgi:hypothetical protein